MERIFRTATIDLAKKHAFARSLVNTGRMAVANPYSRSPITAPDLPQSYSVQNVDFLWANNSTGCLNQLLQWAKGLPLLLLWPHASRDTLAAVRRLAQEGQLRAVAVLPHRAMSFAWRECVVDGQGRLAQACGVEMEKVEHGEQAWALIRPDSYLAARGSASASLQKAVCALQGDKP